VANRSYKPTSETLGYLRSIQRFLAGEASDGVLRPATLRAHLSKAHGLQVRDILFLERYLDPGFSVKHFQELWKRDFTEYEDLVTSTFLWQAANDVLEALAFYELAVPEGIALGSLPLEFANARVLHSPAGTPIIAVNNGFVAFLYSMAKSVGLSYIFEEPKDGQFAVSAAPALDAGTDEERADFADRVSEYISTGYCGDALRDVLEYVEKANFVYIKSLFRHAFTFVLAHEYAHIALEDPANTSFVATATSIEADAPPHWKREFYADEIALFACRHRWISLQDIPTLILCGVGILFFFSCVKFIETLRPPSSPESHPPILVRQRRVSLLLTRPELPVEQSSYLTSLVLKNASALMTLHQRTSCSIQGRLEAPRIDMEERRRWWKKVEADVTKQMATESIETPNGSD